MSQKNTAVIKQHNKPLKGTLRVPSDKSITQRAYIFGAMAEGVTTVNYPLNSADAEATLTAVISMGAELISKTEIQVVLRGVGDKGFTAPANGVIDCQNSGTGMRILCGAIAGQDIAVSLTGDESLNKRPMERVAIPLRGMGATINTQDGKPPIEITGGNLTAIEYHSPVASAQIKTCVLTAGLQADGKTVLVEPQTSRDHSEKMLPSFGIELHSQKNSETGENRVTIQGGQKLKACEINVPADPSSAAFIMVAASLVPNSDVTLTDVGMNPGRSGLLKALRSMGANIEIQNARFFGEEPVADLRIQGQKLNAANIKPADVVDMVDEIPVLMVAASLAEGVSHFEGLRELRVKESDRLALMIDNLKATGVDCKITEGDGAIVHGSEGLQTLAEASNWTVEHDHRLAMAGAVAGLCSPTGVHLDDVDAVAVSWPNFLNDLQALAS